MIGDQKQKDDGFVSIATKVPVWIADLLTILAQQRGMEVYELLQLLVNGFIAAAKHDGPMTPDMRMLVESLKLDVAFNKAFNFASPTSRNEIAQVVLILQQPGRKGFGLKMIDRPFMDSATETMCVDDILERVVEVSMKGLYRQLMRIGYDLGSDSMRETLTIMCDAQKIVNIENKDKAELPGYGEFHDYGRRIEYGNKCRRKKRRTVDSVANSQPHIVFDDYDKKIADYEAAEWEGEHIQREAKPEGC